MSVKRIDLEFHGFLGLCTGSCWLCSMWTASGHWRCLVRLSAEDISSHSCKEGSQSKHHYLTLQGGNFISPQPEIMWQRSLAAFTVDYREPLCVQRPLLNVLRQWEALLQSLCEGHAWLLANRRRKSSPELIELQDVLIAECWLTKTQFWQNKRMFNWVCRKNDADHNFLMQTLCVHFKTYRCWLIDVIS